MEKLYIVSKKRGADCGSDHKLIAKFRLKLKKIGKSTRRFRYDTNQIPYDYTVEVTNRFKRLDLIESLKKYEQRFMTLYRRQGSRSSPRKRNAKRQNGCLMGPYKQLKKEEMLKAKEKRKGLPTWIQSYQRIARRDNKDSLSDQWKEIEGNNKMWRTRDLFKNIRDTEGTFHAKMGTIKNRNYMDLTEAEDTTKRWQTTQNYTKKILMTQIITMLWSLT